MVFCNRETISIHIGQAGCQLASSTWELYCLEHGINPDGTLDCCHSGDNNDIGLHTFFCESQTGKFVPRAVLIDTEPTVSEVKTFSIDYFVDFIFPFLHTILFRLLIRFDEAHINNYFIQIICATLKKMQPTILLVDTMRLDVRFYQLF
jgi:hypothetical protein